MQIYVIAYYYIGPIEDPDLEVKKHKEFLGRCDARARIYFTKDGINGQMSIAKSDFEEYKQFLYSDERFCNIDLKLDEVSEHSFPKLTIKVKKELVSIRKPIDFCNRGEYIESADFKKELEKRDKNTIVVDVRNDYEGKLGYFEGAIIPDAKVFREFDVWTRELAEKYDTKKTKVLMYCTGGIRCEVFSPMMKEAGFENVFQLKGGVIKYGKEQGNAFFKGRLFVFDDRLVVPISDEPSEPIASCAHCSCIIDRVYNCANMSCNALFVACRECAKEHKGCCKEECKSERVRPFIDQENPMPYRKLSFCEKKSIKKSPLTALA
jgi:UPF0176 protein